MDNLGDRLKAEREKLKLTIDDVSQKIKIRHQFIEALENNNFSVLPKVYINSFIRTYSSFLKIPEEEIYTYYKDSTKKATIKNQPSEQGPINSEQKSIKEYYYKQPVTKKTKLIIGKRKNQIIYYIIYSLLFIAIFILAYLLFFSNRSSNSTADYSLNSGKLPDTAVVKSSDGLANYYIEKDSFNLTAIGKDSAFVILDIDNQKRNEIIHFYRGLEKSWNAKDKFVLNISKEGAIEFKRDGQVLAPFGPFGSPIRRVVITRNEVISSSQSWLPLQDSIRKKTPSKNKKDTQETKINKKFELDFSPIPQPENPFKK